MATVRLRNVNPIGAVDLPLIGRTGDNGEWVEHEPDEDHVHPALGAIPYLVRVPVEGSGCLEAGEVFEVDAEVAKALLEQVGNYELVTEKKSAKAGTDTTKAG